MDGLGGGHADVAGDLELGRSAEGMERNRPEQNGTIRERRARASVFHRLLKGAINCAGTRRNKRGMRENKKKKRAT